MGLTAQKIKTGVYLLLLSTLPILAVWAPFILRMESVMGIPIPAGGMQILAANYDGPLYIVIAKSLYNLEYIAANFSFPLPLEYYAAHFPLYPLLIRLFSFAAGYPWGMLLLSHITSFFCILYFYLFARDNISEKHALWLTAVFAVFPARWLIVRSVGSPEPLFIGTIIASVYHFNKKQYWLAGIWGGLAQLTKSPAILLFVAYSAALTIPRVKELATNHNLTKWLRSLEYRAYPIALIPASLLGLFYVYKIQFDDFFAYFNSGDNIHLFFPPFQIFDYSQPWVGTHWLEEIIFIYLVGAIGVVYLFKQKSSAASWFVAIFFASVLFVSHRDIMRYSLPIVPFLFAAYAKVLVSREFRLAFALIIVPIYLFTLVFIVNNVTPISNWGAFL